MSNFISIINITLSAKENVVKELLYSEFGDLNEPIIEKLISGLISLKKANVLSGDVDRMDHWGITADNRLVLLDYGFTEDVRSKHYNDNITTKHFD